MRSATAQTYAFLQVASTPLSSSAVKEKAKPVVQLVKNLATKHHSQALFQLASRLDAAVHIVAGGDPFSKVKALLTNMISKLQAEASKEETETNYCESELAKSQTEKSNLEGESDAMKGKMDQAAASSARAMREIRQLNAELAALAKLWAELEAIRDSEHKVYSEAKADLQMGLDGIRSATKALQEYYATKHESVASLLQDSESMAESMRQPSAPGQFSIPRSRGGPANSIISLFDVMESEFAKGLAEIETQERDQISEYKEMTKAFTLNKATKLKDIDYKTKRYKGLDQIVNDLGNDYSTLGQELAALGDYLAKLQERCVATPTAYLASKRRRDAEVNGLREALSELSRNGITSSAPSFLQIRLRH